ATISRFSIPRRVSFASAGTAVNSVKAQQMPIANVLDTSSPRILVVLEPGAQSDVRSPDPQGAGAVRLFTGRLAEGVATAHVASVLRDLFPEQFVQRHPDHRCGEPADSLGDISGTDRNLELVERTLDLDRGGEAQELRGLGLRLQAQVHRLLREVRRALSRHPHAACVEKESA